MYRLLMRYQDRKTAAKSYVYAHTVCANDNLVDILLIERFKLLKMYKWNIKVYINLMIHIFDDYIL